MKFAWPALPPILIKARKPERVARLGVEYFTLSISLAPYETLMPLHPQVFKGTQKS